MTLLSCWGREMGEGGQKEGDSQQAGALPLLRQLGTFSPTPTVLGVSINPGMMRPP